MKSNVSVLVFLILSSTSFANSHISKTMTFNDVAFQTLEYAIGTQIRSTDDKFYRRGEWPTQVQSTLLPWALGIGRIVGEDQEATDFTTASVITILGRIYLDFPEFQKLATFQKIPMVVKEGVSTLLPYGDGVTYNFYPAYLQDRVIVHRPVNMKLNPRWYGLTNIPNDADTTSAVESALVFNGKINGTVYEPSQQTFAEFSKFRDVQRQPMSYNKKEKIKESGAFMTWLYDENDPRMPLEEFADPKRGARIPFGRNDVDCVVNANILKLISLAHRPEVEGAAEACELITHIIEDRKESECGIYYPNTMNLFFSMAMAEEAGDKCLSQSLHEKIVSRILASQMNDGSWINENKMWADPNITTAFAMYSLLHFGDESDPQVKGAVRSGVQFLLPRGSRNGSDQIRWGADNFFTAVALARSMIVWRSSAYTNLIVGAVLLKIGRSNPELNLKEYLKIRH